MEWNKIPVIILLSGLSYSTIASDKDTAVVNKTLKVSALEIVKDADAINIINKYIDAIGGREKLLSIKDKTTNIISTVEGIEMKMTIYQKAPNKYKLSLNLAEIKQVIYFDGKKGMIWVNGELNSISDEQFNDMVREADIHFLADFENKNVTVRYAGKEDVDGKVMNKLEFITPNGDSWYSFFEESTNLLVKEIHKSSSLEFTQEQEVTYSNYTEVDGIKFPMKIQTDIGEDTLILDISSIEINKGLKDIEFEIPDEEEGE